MKTKQKMKMGVYALCLLLSIIYLAIAVKAAICDVTGWAMHKNGSFVENGTWVRIDFINGSIPWVTAYQTTRNGTPIPYEYKFTLPVQCDPDITQVRVRAWDERNWTYPSVSAAIQNSAYTGTNHSNDTAPGWLWGAGTANAWLNITLNRAAHPNISISSNATNVNVLTGVNATYLLNITNLALAEDDINLTFSSNASNVYLNETSVTNLSTNQSWLVELNVNAAGTGNFTTNITAFSLSNQSVTAKVSVYTITTPAPIYNVTISSNQTEATIYTDGNATYLLNITNLGNVADSFTIFNISNAPNAWLNETTITNLPSLASYFIELYVWGAIGGNYSTNVTAVSNSDNDANSTVEVNTTILFRQVGITAAPLQKTGYNNTNTSYTVYITNTGTAIDSYTLTNQTNASFARLNQTTLNNIGPGQTVQVVLNVSDPIPGSYETNISVNSTGDALVSNKTSVNTTILEAPIRDVNITANVSLVNIYNNSMAVYLLNITNLGNYPDNFTVSRVTDAANSVLNDTTITELGVGASAQVLLNVSNPTQGMFYTNVNVSSDNDLTAWDNVTVFTNVSEVPFQAVSIQANTGFISVDPGNNATYILNVTNLGNYPDNFTIIRTTNASSAVLNETQTQYINPGQWALVILNVSDPSSGSYSTNVTATSQVNKSVNASVIVTTQVTPNLPPSQPTVDVTPNIPNSAQYLNCTVTGASTDPEAQPVSYYYEWYKNSVWNMSTTNLSQTTHILDAGNTTKNEVWNCTVTPHDGVVNGTANSDAVLVLNTAPTINVNITPDVASTINNLTCSGIYYDLDGDSPGPISFSFTGDYAETGSANCAPISTTTYNCTANVSYVNTTDGDSITCEMIPDDTEVFGASDSDTVVIAQVTAPLNLEIRINSSDLESTILNWTASPDATYYAIFWSSNETEMRLHDPYYDTPDATTTQTRYTDFTAPQVTERYYRVAAVKPPAYNDAPETVGKMNLSLQAGQNLISLPLQPPSNSINELVVPPATSSYDRITRYVPGQGWQRTDYYGPAWKWWGFFSSIDPDKGYYFYPTKEAYTIPVAGQTFTDNRTVPISAGSNLIGWSSVYTKQLSNVLAPPTNEDRMTRFIPGSGWERTDYYTGYGWYGKFTTLEPGRGYWFYPTGQSYTWEYDPK